MSFTTITSRQFNQDASGAKRAAALGPVFITDRGQLAHVLLTIEDYQELTNRKESIVELLAMPEVADIEFEVPKMQGLLHKPEEFD